MPYLPFKYIPSPEGKLQEMMETQNADMCLNLATPLEVSGRSKTVVGEVLERVHIYMWAYQHAHY